MASTTSTGVETIASGPQTQTVKERLHQFVEFLYNPDDCTIFGRTARRWGEILLFYMFFYIFLAAFFAAMLAIFYQIMDWNTPKLTGSDSLLKGNPGLGFRPMPDVSTTLIRFEKSDATTYTMLIDHIESYLQYYENIHQVTETGSLIECESYTKRRPMDEWDKACRFDITTNLGSDCVKQQAFGFEDGQPCILLKMNKLFDWTPEEFTNETVPSDIRDQWSQYHVTLVCVGENPSDQDNMGEITYYPSNGFHFKYFPFRNQQGFRSPLVFVRFEDPRPGVLLMITCKIHAKNIYHDFLEKAGSVHFELLVD